MDLLCLPIGISLPFVSGIIALSISESTFQAEIFRAGINSIKKAQWKQEVRLD